MCLQSKSAMGQWRFFFQNLYLPVYVMYTFYYCGYIVELLQCDDVILQGPYILSGKTSYRQISNPPDWVLYWPYHSEIWQIHRQEWCRCICQISEWLDKSKPEYRGFKTSRDLAVRRLIALWIEALKFMGQIPNKQNKCAKFLGCNLRSRWCFFSGIGFVKLRTHVNSSARFLQCIWYKDPGYI